MSQHSLYIHFDTEEPLRLKKTKTFNEPSILIPTNGKYSDTL